jgi:hypothetical protein
MLARLVSKKSAHPVTMADGRLDPRTLLSVLALLVSCGSLYVAWRSTNIAHDDRTRDLGLSVDAQVRNLSAGERAFGAKSDAQAGQRLEYRVRAFNTGNVSAKDVSVAVATPDANAGRLVPGSCRVIVRGTPQAPCPDTMDDRHLRRARLSPDEAYEVRFQVITEAPPCNRYEAKTSFTVHTADRDDQRAEVSAYVARPQADHLECGTNDALMMGLIPATYRSSCGLGQPNRAFSDFLAHVVCTSPGDGVDYVETFLYATEAETKESYEQRYRLIDLDDEKQCSDEDDGFSGITYEGRSRPEFFFVCWSGWEGESFGSTVEAYSLRYKYYIRAHRPDLDVTSLYQWTKVNAP